MSYYAHSTASDNTKWQSLKEHLENTARLAFTMGSDSGLSELGQVAALLHDIGKYSGAFQRKLGGENIRVDHSTAGAQEALRLFRQDPIQSYIATILAYCIAGHHSGLLDYGSEIDLPTDGTLLARLKKSVEDYQSYAQEIDTSNIALPAYLPIKPIRNYSGFSVAFLTRMLYSLLTDADFLETETFMNDGRMPRGDYQSVEILSESLTQYLTRYQNPGSPIDKQRTATLRDCIAKAEHKPGLFTLTLPTGGGKTLISLSFAMQHAVLHGMQRIIYVIPYTSIIEQNAARFKQALGVENVLEHHSNFDWGEKSQGYLPESKDVHEGSALQKLKLAAENWDIPIVVTTNVQFFESLFANRSSRCRKIHNIANSVIIFDEAQMLPREYLKPCLFAAYELVKNYSVTAVFCTATQPSVERFLPEGAQLEELAQDPYALYEFYKRVQVVNAGVISDADLIQHINYHKQALCIVNTRKHARGVFLSIVDEGRFHLSTLMCPAHRQKTIASIKQRLEKKQPCRVVSTQIMEAGIDVDFPVGFRAISGLDSIIQAAGRVNRERKSESGLLYVFEPDSVFVSRTPAYIEQGAAVARMILREYDDPVSAQAIQAYYQQLYNLQDPRAFDAKDILNCFEKGVPAEANFDFKTAADKFKLIPEDTFTVIVPYDHQAERLLQEVRFNQSPQAFARALQVYSVNIYDQEFLALQLAGVIDFYADRYAVLNDMGYYNSETGLSIPESRGAEAIFFDG